ncbi:hypothetical protein [Prosthecobacter sp.]|uniref:hypothetical protein n=1 Tax=Prosthecobacter sp. TaxID=1965333 RepID=UPI0037837FBF
MSTAGLIRELKARLRIDEAWRLLHLPGEAGRCCKSPFRPEERHASFSVYAEGTRAKDHATGETFDVVDFIKKALDCDTAGAVRWMREQAGAGREATPQAPKRQAERKARPWPPMLRGNAQELDALAKLRTLSLPAVRLADERGFLHFGQQWGRAFWCITDAARRGAELRRMDGELWPGFGEVPARKAHCYGDKTWPVGLMEAESFPNLLFVEGVGDFLAAHAVIDGEGRAADVAALCCMGAAVQLLPEVAARLTGKRVRIIPQMDEPGQRAALSWARSLRNAGAKVDGFSLAGIRDAAGESIKDLGDLFAKASAESIRAHPELLEVCP